MKMLSTVVKELREQVEEATDPKDSTKLIRYLEALREGIGSLVDLLPNDPTIAALAFYGQIRFVGSNGVFVECAEKGSFVKDDWAGIKGSILVKPVAHGAFRLLEEKNLQEVLAIAVVANYKLKQRCGVEAEQEEYETV